MALITDRHLVVQEPLLYTLAADVGTQILTTSDASVSGTTLTSAASDFESEDVGEDDVAIVEGKSIEVVARLQVTQLEVSLPRPTKQHVKVPPGDGNNLTLDVVSFSRVIDQVHDGVLRSLSIDPDDPLQPLDENDIVNPDALAVFLVLETTAQVFATAAASHPSDEKLSNLAALYAHRATRAAGRTSVIIDTDGDGEGDVTRHLNVVNFIRR